MDNCGQTAMTAKRQRLIGNHAARFLSTVPLGDMVLISDYGKGVCTRSLLRSLVNRAHDVNVPILVDPARSRDWSDYGRVTLIKANWAEAMEAVGNHDVRPLTLARRLSDERNCHVVVTLGRYGLVCAERSGYCWYWPAESVDSKDVCGAGDTVLAAMAVALAAGQSMWEASRFTVQAAARQVSSIGITTISATYPNNPRAVSSPSCFINTCRRF